MADQKISELTNLLGSNIEDGDEFVVVDSSASQTKAITASELRTAIGNGDFTVTGDLTVQGTTITVDSAAAQNIVLGDNDKMTFGAGSDLQIYHDGAHSRLKETGQGDFYFDVSNSLFIRRNDTSALMASFETGTAKLYYDNAEKLATTSTGIDVTGDLSINDGTPAYLLKVSGVEKGYVRSNSDVTEINGASGSALRQNGFMKLNTTSTGIDVTGTVTADGLTVGNGTQQARFYIDADEVSQLIDGNVRYDIWTGGDKTMRLDANGDISFYEDTGTTAKFFWDASAESLGIGTSSPLSPLHINVGANQNLRVFSASSTPTIGSLNDANSAYAALGYTGSQHEFRIGTTEAMRIDSSGNVGIGASSIASGGSGTTNFNLHTPSATSVYMKLSNSSTGNTASDGFDLSQDSSGNAYLINRENANMTFWTNTSERLRIDSSGRVGIGTNSPTQKLQVKDTTASNTSTYISVISGTAGNAGITFGDSSSTLVGGVLYNNADNALRFFKNGFTEAARIDSSGNLLVGTTSFTGTSGVSLSATGYVYASSTNDVAIYANRETSDGDIAVFRKDGSTVGSIGSYGGASLSISKGSSGLLMDNSVTRVLPFNGATNTPSDGAVALGGDTERFKDLYLSGGVYLGGTGSANKLDDYETGYHQTTIQMGSGSATATSTNDLLYYTIIGNMCFITGNIGINSVSSPSGTFSFTVPFAVDTGLSETSERAAGTVHLNGFSSENGSGIGFIENGSAVYVKTYARNNPVPTGACEMHINIFYPIA